MQLEFQCQKCEESFSLDVSDMQSDPVLRCPGCGTRAPDEQMEAVVAGLEELPLGKLVEAGMDVARLNFSHGTHDDHLRALDAVRKAAEMAGRPIGVLLDLQGPKIRVGKIEGGKVKLEPGAETVITVDSATPGNAQKFACSYEGLPDDVSLGDPVLINDGAIRLEVIGIVGKEVRCRVLQGGWLSDHKGINLPGTPVSIPAMTPKDIED